MLNELNIECSDVEYPFNPEEQIQPCSIDLRLSNVFWEPSNFKRLDLRRSRLLEVSPRRFWKKKTLGNGECITLKPGKMLLGRTYEKFTIPNSFAGKIEGRSSFSRLGLSVHCTGDFINPGYRGQMPLEIINHSRATIKIFPHLPICQLIIVPLSSNPERGYGHEELQSKYMDDDGGPSYWWRDKRIARLQAAFEEVNLEIRIQEQILERVGIQEPEVIERFETFLGKKPVANLDSADSLLEEFARSEDRTRTKDKMITGGCYALFPILASASLGALYYSQAFTWGHYVVFGVTLLSLLLFGYALLDTPKEYLGTGETRKLLNK
ncbi:MAG: dCTP deaminase [Blastocatellia bacterium]|nr:dCTP deaminase [Blastocatellia bacterium]